MFKNYEKEIEKLGFRVSGDQVVTPRGDVVASFNAQGGVETKEEGILAVLSKPVEKKAPKKEKPRKRARTKKGTYRADDPSTPDINEAYE